MSCLPTTVGVAMYLAMKYIRWRIATHEKEQHQVYSMVEDIIGRFNSFTVNTGVITYTHYHWYGKCQFAHQMLLIEKSSPSSGGNRFPLSLSEWSFTICQTPYNHKKKG